MINTYQNAEKFLNKLSADPSCFRVQITPEGNLLYEGAKNICISDFIAIHDGKLWGRAGTTWLPSTPIPEATVNICAFSLKRLAIFKSDGTVDCVSPKKELDPGTAFLLCTKFPSGIRLLIADPSTGKMHIALTLCRDENGENFCRALVQQFVKHRLPDQVETLNILLGENENT